MKCHLKRKGRYMLSDRYYYAVPFCKDDPMAQVSALVDTLKASLKAAGIKYTQVAAALQLSESSIKRKFSKKEFSLASISRADA